MKKSVILCFALLAALWAFAVGAQAATVQSGACGAEGDGSGVTWALSDTGVLTVSGSGAMQNWEFVEVEMDDGEVVDFYEYLNNPWYPYRAQIKTAVIGSGVTNVGAYSFYECDKLTAVTLPAGLTAVGRYAFSGCKALTAVTLPAGLNTLGMSSFSGCKALTAVAVPDSVTVMGAGAFSGCTGLQTAALPAGVTTIPAYTFYNCAALTSCAIPSGVTAMESSAFYGCAGLTEVAFPAGLKTVGENAYSGCTGLTEIALPAGLTTVGAKAFYGCTALDDITLPNSVRSVGSQSFHNTAWYNSQPEGPVYLDRVFYKYKGAAPAETEYKFQTDTLVIADEAFLNCGWLTDVSLPEGLLAVGARAFAGCGSLPFAEVFTNVSRIGADAFPAATTIYCKADAYAKNWAAANGRSCYTLIETGNCGNKGDNVKYRLYSDGMIILDGAGKMADFEGYEGADAAPWMNNHYDSIRAAAIKKGVSSIGNSLFYNCQHLSSVIIPDSVTSIGRSSFCWNYSLSDLVIPNSVTSIGDDAFAFCSALTELIIPDSVVTIYANALSYCTALKRLEFGKGLVSFGQCYNGGGSTTFAYCSALESITVSPENPTYFSSGNCMIEKESKTLVLGCKNSVIPTDGSVTHIGDHAFYGCSELNNIIIPSFVETIESCAFLNCTGLTGYIDLRNTTFIGPWAFQDCTGLTGVLFQKTVTIWDGAFEGCSGLEEIALPEGEYYQIESNVFSNCTGLKKVTIGNGVSGIGPGAFSGCNKLMTISIPNSVRSILYSAFYNCQSLEEIELPPQLTKIANNTFQNCVNLQTVSIPEGVTSIGDFAFDGCAALPAVQIPAAVQSIGANAFRSCEALTEVTIPEGVPALETGTFAGCTGLELLYLPDSVTAIGKNAIPAGVTVAGSAGSFAHQWAVANGHPFREVLQAANVTLYADKVAYNGKRRLPPATVKNAAGETLTKGQDFTVTYDAGMTDCGVYTVTVKGINGYAGTVEKSFTIAPASPAGVTVKATADRELTVSWSAVPCATQYNVYRYNGEEYRYVGVTSAAAEKPTQFVNTGLTLGTDYYYKVMAVYKKAGVTVTGAFSAAAHAVALGKPGVPKNLTVKGSGEKELTLTWSAVKGATQYNIYRYNGAKNAYVYLATTLATAENPTQYVDAGLTMGTTYYYKVMAVCKGSGLTFTGEYSAAASAMAPGKPGAPRNVTAKGSAEKELTLTWSAVTGATQYNVYRYNGAKNAYVYLATTYATAENPTRYVDAGLTMGTTYYYKVMAVCKSSGLTFTGEYSAAASAMAPGKPGVPKNVKAEATLEKEIILTWSAVTGATQYNVYRYKGSAYQYLGTVSASAESPTRYVDAGLTVGVSYSYKIMAVCKGNGLTFTGEFSAAVSALAIDENYLEPPKGLTAAGTAVGQITLRWNAVSRATQYNIYRYNGAKKEYVYKGTVFASAADPTQYIDKDLNPGTTYYYKVVAVRKANGNTVISDLSAAAHATAPVPPALPEQLIAYSTMRGSVALMWDTVDAATQYNLYRYDSAKNAFVYIGTSYSYHYLVSGLNSGETYRFRIVSVTKTAEATLVSEPSASVSAAVR